MMEETTVEYEKTNPLYMYNLANGYSALAFIAKKKGETHFNPNTTPLVEAKRYYRIALERLRDVNPQFGARIYTNYGNCLASLGRDIEAIDKFRIALSYDSDNPVAWGELGALLEHFTFVSFDATLLNYAYESLTKCLESRDLEKVGGLGAGQCYDKVRKRVKSFLDNLNLEDSSKRLTAQAFPSEQHRDYAKFCQEKGLFLNFCLKGWPCANAGRDTIGLSLITPIDDNTTFPRLARIVNEVKEKYALARLLFYEASVLSSDENPYDWHTRYIYNLDYSVYGIHVAKLKLAFESAYNVLDKIAFFIHDYLDLGMKEQDINFSSIWREPKSKPPVLRLSILELNNGHLCALYDISRDLGPKGYLSRLRETRNYLTHRYLVPHTETIRLLTEADGPDYHIGYRELWNRTLELMQLVRNSVIYLVASIGWEERQKSQKLQKKKKPPGQIVVPPYDFPPIGPLDSPI